MGYSLEIVVEGFLDILRNSSFINYWYLSMNILKVNTISTLSKITADLSLSCIVPFVIFVLHFYHVSLHAVDGSLGRSGGSGTSRRRRSIIVDLGY